MVQQLLCHDREFMNIILQVVLLPPPPTMMHSDCITQPLTGTANNDIATATQGAPGNESSA